jgi:hypothetical protein
MLRALLVSGCIVCAGCNKQAPSADAGAIGTVSTAKPVISGGITTTDTGRFKNTGAITGRIFQIKNTSTKPIKWVGFHVLYFDGVGKELFLYDGRVTDSPNGVTFAETIPAGQTVEMALGELQSEEPAGTQRADAVARKIIFDDGTTWTQP